MLVSIRLVPELEWRIKPFISKLVCDDGECTRISFPFFSLWLLREKVA